MSKQTFGQRCRICGHETNVPLGPEAFSESAYLLAEHIHGHSDAELIRYALYSHGRDVGEAAQGVAQGDTRQ